MKHSGLGYLQVATMLISASYGIGFLFGSGELAVTQGMAGSMYGLVTGFGMLLLAGLAGRIWSKRLPIWDMLGQFYGPIVKRSVVLLSVVWMTGVLAAQIKGGTAILATMGLSHFSALALSLLMIFGASKINLEFASKLFLFCLVASSGVLIYILFYLDGLSIYFNAIPKFVNDIQNVDGKEIFVMTVGVAFLVVTGADYQQFVIAAKNYIDAVVGCVFAAVFLLLASALPASAVIAASDAGILSEMEDAKQVIPFLISYVTAHMGSEWETLFFVGLLFAALGSGAAIVRAMTGAVSSATSIENGKFHLMSSVMVILIGAIVASRQQAIIDTIIELNIVYIASIAPIFLFLLLGIELPQRGAQKAIAAGFICSIFFYIVKWLGFANGMIDIYSLCVGILASTFFLLISHYEKIREI